MWQVADSGWVYVVADSERAGRVLETGPIDTLAGVVRKAEISDPDGNRITFGESLKSESP